MKHISILAAALVASATFVGGTAATAQVAGSYYQAVPVAQPGKTKFVTRTTIWRQQGSSYVAGQAPERDMIVCQLVAKQTGGLTSFTAGGRAYDADALAQCNGKKLSALVASTSGQGQ